MPPRLTQGPKTRKFFNRTVDDKGRDTFTIKSEEQYARETNVPFQPSKKYFKYRTLPEIVDKYTMKDGLSPEELKKGMRFVHSFIRSLISILSYPSIYSSNHPSQSM